MNELLIRVALSFIVAGVWITLVTILSERLGTKIGGLIGNMPSNILVSLLFIGWTQTPEFAASAARIVPLAMVIDTIFLFIFIICAKKYGLFSFIPAFLAWILLAYPIGTIAYDNILFGTLVYLIITIFLFYIIEFKLHIPSIEKKEKKSYSLKELLMRACLSGGVVASAILIAAFLGPTWGGIFSIFPAVMFSTMYLLTKSKGVDFSRAAGKVMLLASTNNIFFAIGIVYTYPKYGLIIGTVLSYLASALCILLISPLMKKIK